jgi:hypothetical protein
MPELLTYDARACTTEAEWEQGYDRFVAAREEWCRQHGLEPDALPLPQFVGDCPYNPYPV